MTQESHPDVLLLEQRLIGPASPYSLIPNRGGGYSFKYGPKSLLTILEKARDRGDRTLINYGGWQLSYRDVFRRAQILIERISQNGLLSFGDRVGLTGDDPIEWISSFIAIVFAGGVPVLLPVDERNMRCDLITQTQCRYIVIAGDSSVNRGDLMIPSIVASSDHVGEQALDTDRRSRDVRPDESGKTERRSRESDPALISFSSGTSGTPKAILQSNMGLCSGIMNMMLSAASGGSTPATANKNAGLPKPLICGPLYHITSYMQLLTMMMLGAGVVITRISDPVKLAEAVEWHGATSILGIDYANAIKLLSVSDASERLRSLRSWTISGARPVPRLHRLISQVLPDTAVYCSYGLTETNGGIASFRLRDNLGDLNCCGRPVRTVRVEVRDEANNVMAAGEPGHIWVTGDMLFTGYVDGNSVSRPDGDWFDTGDRGLLTSEGYLLIFGRGEDADRPAKYFEGLVSLENKVLELSAIVDAGLINHNGRVLAGVVLNKTSALICNDLATLIADELKIALSDVLVIVFKAIPRTQSGKLKRAEIIDHAANMPPAEGLA